MGDSYVWIGGASGNWSLASNWKDTTTNANPATVAPDSSSSVTISAGSGVSDTILGPGSASSLTITGSVAFSGQFTTGTFTNNGALSVNSSATLTVTGNFGDGVGSTVTTSGTLNVSGNLTGNNTTFEADTGGLLTVTGNASDTSNSSYHARGGTITVNGTLTSNGNFIVASNGGKIRFANLAYGGNQYGSSVELQAYDSTSSVEIGTAGNAAAGTVTIDAGVSVTEDGTFFAPTIVNNGTVTVESGTSSAFNTLNLSGTLTGSGAFQIGSYAILNVGAVSATATNSLTFTGIGGILDIGSSSLTSGVFRPVISGFNSNDAIDYNGTVTSASYSNGTLTLLNGSSTVATLSLSGISAGSSFIATTVGSTGTTQISMLGTGDTSTAPVGTSSADQYVWNGPIAGSWDVASNWKDTTTNANPATLAPGSNDAVSVTAGSTIADVITGKGNSSSLTIAGSVAFSGQFTTGSFTNNGFLSLNTGATLTVTGNFGDGVGGSVTVGSGTLNVAGNLTANFTSFEVDSGGLLAITGNLTEANASAGSGYNARGGTITVGGTVTTNGNNYIIASGGGKIRFANLAYGGSYAGSSVVLEAYDSASSVEIGTAGNAATGTVTIDAGVSVTEDGTFFAPTIVNNGTVIVEPGTSSAYNTLNLSGTLTGSGAFQVGNYAILNVGAVSASATNTIAFTGTSGVLDITSSSLNSSIFRPVISGFNSTDAIDYSGTVTSASYANGTLTLFNGATTVATLSLSGISAGSSFIASPLGSVGMTQINLLGTGDTSTAPVGTSSADQYVWNGPIAGSWDVASNWKDTTTNANPATLAPGANDAVSITAGSSIADVITGKGNSSSLTIAGSVAFSGQFTTGTFTDNGALSVSSNATLTVTGNFGDAVRSAVTVGSGTLNIGGNLTGNFTSFEVDSGGLLAVTGNVSESNASAGSGYGARGGTITVGGTVTTNGNNYVIASGGGKIRFANLAYGGNYAGSSVVLEAYDNNSSVEIGTAGNAAVGSVTIDTGVTVTEDGTFFGPTIVNNGTVIVQSGTSGANNTLNLSGMLTGNGAFQIGSYAILNVGAVSAASANTIAFTGTNGILEITSSSLNSSVFRPVISGFSSTDAIDYNGTVTNANYSGGTLTLLNGTTTVATLTLTGSYAGDTFIATSIGGGLTQITVNGSVSQSPTLSVTSLPSATRGQVINLSSLVSISDPTYIGYQTLQLWDSNGTVAGGEFKIGGTAQPANTAINVSAANIANTVFDVGTLGGTDTLYAQLIENNGQGSGWQKFTVTAPTVSPPTLTVTSLPSATRGQVINLSSLVTVSDPNSVGYQTLELWDSAGTVGGGEFKIGGTAQPGGQTINVSPSNVANVVFDVGTLGGTDTLYAQLVQNDSSLSGWQKFTVTAPTVSPPTLTVTSLPSATRGQVINLASLVTISDPNSVGYQTLELWDSNGTVGGGEFKIGGTAQPGGQTINVSPANVANTVFDVGTLGGTDTLYAQLVQNDGTLSGWHQFTVTAPVAAPPTLAVTSQPSATRGQVINLSSLVSISDPNSVGYQTLQLWDSNGTVGGGEFKIGGVAEPAGQAINVSAANFANTVFDVGTLGGTDTLWAQLVQNNGTQSGWQQFMVTAPVATPPTLAVTSVPSASRGQAINLSSLVTISDPSTVGYQKLELWDSNGTPSSGQFVVSGSAQTGGHEIDIVPTNVANTVFDVGTLGGTDTLWARLLQNDGSLSGWMQFSVTAPKPPPPTLSVTSVPSASRGQVINLSSLVTISDPSAVGYQKLELWDSSGTPGGGQFVVNGSAQTGGHEIDVTPANVANTVFDVGTLGGTDTLWAQLLQSDGSLSGWMQFSVTAPELFLPTLSVINDGSAVAGQSLALSNLVTISDPSALGYQKLELWDSNGTATGGQFVINGAAQTGGHEIDVAPTDVTNTVFDVGTLGGTDTLWARLLQNDGSTTSWQQFSVTAPAPTGPIVSGPVNASGAKGTGTFTVNLLQNATDNNALHVANLVWTDTGSGLPAGFTVSADGNSMMVDTNSLAYSNTTSTFSTHFSYRVVDSLGLQAPETATISITPT